MAASAGVGCVPQRGKLSRSKTGRCEGGCNLLPIPPHQPSHADEHPGGGRNPHATHDHLGHLHDDTVLRDPATEDPGCRQGTAHESCGPRKRDPGDRRIALPSRRHLTLSELLDFGIREIPEFTESGLEILVLLQFCIAKATLSTVTGCTYIFLPTIGARYTWSGCERAPSAIAGAILNTRLRRFVALRS